MMRKTLFALTIIVFSSSCIADAGDTLMLMRKSLHVKIEDALNRAEANAFDVNSVLEWVAHVSLPNVTNEAAYFLSYKSPLDYRTYDINLLTNRAARLSQMPPMVKLSLAYDGEAMGSVSRAIPGVDYPGIENEDAGSNANHLRMALCAPTDLRHIQVKAEVMGPYRNGYDFCWMSVSGALQRWGWQKKEDDFSSVRELVVRTSQVSTNRPVRVAVFAREKGKYWGPPSFVEIRPDDYGSNRSYMDGRLFSIDYGNFKDVYRYDGKDSIIGFTRLLAGSVHGDEYSYFGERIVEGFDDERPKITRKVHYGVKDGRLVYEEIDGDVRHLNEPIENRAIGW